MAGGVPEALLLKSINFTTLDDYPKAPYIPKIASLELMFYLCCKMKMEVLEIMKEIDDQHIEPPSKFNINNLKIINAVTLCNCAHNLS